MIRVCKETDYNSLKQLLAKEFNHQYRIELINNIKTFDQCFVYEDNEIHGYVGAKIYDKSKNKHDLVLFVDKDWRKKGIGTQLYKEIMSYFASLNPKTIRVIIEKKNKQSITFFKNKAFKKWYGSNHMKYDGPKIENNGLKVVPFSDDYFNQYINLLIDAFYIVRKDGNIHPSRIPNNQAFRDFKWQFRNNIYLVLNNDEMIGSYRVDGNHVEDLFVSPKYQGKGYGKKLTHSIINKILEKHDAAYLYVIDSNKKAIHMYLACGFKFIKQSDVYIKGDIID